MDANSLTPKANTNGTSAAVFAPCFIWAAAFFLNSAAFAFACANICLIDALSRLYFIRFRRWTALPLLFNSATFSDTCFLACEACSLTRSPKVRSSIPLSVLNHLSSASLKVPNSFPDSIKVVAGT